MRVDAITDDSIKEFENEALPEGELTLKDNTQEVQKVTILID